jgi:hypothetical protein
MKKTPKSSKRNRFPKGWNEKRVRQVLEHYEGQADAEAAAEDNVMFSAKGYTYMQVPTRLVPAVRKLLAKKAG